VTAAECQSAWAVDSLNAEWAAWLNETINPLTAAGDVAGVNTALAGKQF